MNVSGMEFDDLADRVEKETKASNERRIIADSAIAQFESFKAQVRVNKLVSLQIIDCFSSSRPSISSTKKKSPLSKTKSPPNNKKSKLSTARLSS